MTMRILIITVILSLSFSVQGQKSKEPKNLKDAVLQLDQIVSDSLRVLIQETENGKLKKLSYPWGGDFRTVFEWATRENETSRIRKYLSKKGIAAYQIEVIFIAFKKYQLTGSFAENEILLPFQKREAKWTKEDAIRFSTDSLRGRYIPKDLNDCFNQIDGFWHDSVKVKVANWTEDEFSSKAHFGFGLWMRNNWQLWGGSRLSKYFNNLGVFHPDGMSGIILDSYHRYLTKKPIKFEEQLEEVKAYQQKTQIDRLERERAELTESQLYFIELKVGDTLEFNYNYEFSSESQEEQWIDDSCIAIGILVAKEPEGLMLRVRLIQACGRKGIVIYSNENLRYLNKETQQWLPPKKIKRKYARKNSVKWYNLDDWELY